MRSLCVPLHFFLPLLSRTVRQLVKDDVQRSQNCNPRAVARHSVLSSQRARKTTYSSSPKLQSSAFTLKHASAFECKEADEDFLNFALKMDGFFLWGYFETKEEVDDLYEKLPCGYNMFVWNRELECVDGSYWGPRWSYWKMFFVAVCCQLNFLSVGQWIWNKLFREVLCLNVNQKIFSRSIKCWHQRIGSVDWQKKNPKFTFPDLHQDDKNFKFLKTLGYREKEYLYDHLHKYATVTKTTTQDQFVRVIEYTCRFVTGPSDMEQRILRRRFVFAKHTKQTARTVWI